MKKQKRKSIIILILIFSALILVSFALEFKPGKEIGFNFISFFIEMLKILPCAFVLIGLFEVWVKKESIEKHLGEKSSPLAYIWAILLAGTTVGGPYIAFPVAYSLLRKGARLSVILAYIGASAICKIPMTIFEASFLGLKFSLIRLLVSIPLVIVTSIWLGRYLEKKNNNPCMKNNRPCNR